MPLNISFLAEPSPAIITFYYYYTFLSMLISWIIAPLYFYVVLTQSKILGPFKWLLFNYSLWGLFLTTFMGLVKPIFLTPAFAVIHVGIFCNYGNYLSTFALTAILVAIGTTCMGGMVSTLTYRYLMVFPSILKDWFTIKKAIFFTFLLPSIAYTLLSVVLIQMTHITMADAQAWAIEYDPALQKYFTDKTFFIAPFRTIDVVTKITSIILISSHFGSLFVLAFVHQQMQKYNNIVQTQNNYSIIISIVIQGSLNVLLLISPYTFVITALAFQIPYTVTPTIFAQCIFSTHFLLDSLSTMYCIVPYRKFIMSLSKRNKIKITIIMPSASS